MLFEPGPLRLIRDDELPVPGPRPQFESLVARSVVELRAAGDVIGGELATLAGAAVNELEHDGADQITRAAGVLAAQAPGLDPSVAGVAASVDVLEGELAGLTGQLPADYLDLPPTPPMGEYDLGGGSEPPTGPLLTTDGGSSGGQSSGGGVPIPPLAPPAPPATAPPADAPGAPRGDEEPPRI